MACAAVAEALGLQAFALAAPSSAQTPAPTWYSYDVAPGSGFPGPARYAPHSPNAVVVEGTGSIGCASTVNSIEFYTDLFIDDGDQTITEITPQTVCGNLTEYKDLILGIYENVETSTSNPGRYWGGFMLDEEAGYGFAPATLESLNSGTKTLMDNAGGDSWYFTENQPNSWSTDTYKEIVTGSYDAPQAYSHTMELTIDTACAHYSTYGLCYQQLTVHTTTSTGITATWQNYHSVEASVFGHASEIPGWGTGYWWNAYQNA